MLRTDDDLLRAAARTAERAVEQLRQDQVELAEAGESDGERQAAGALEAARRVSDLLTSSTTSERP